MLAQVRSFFCARQVLEVDTPILGRRGVTDLHIECVQAEVSGRHVYLQSSPEYFMKRLLALGSGPLYYLGKVFRDEETGRRHRPEFTLLEWYRPGWDEFQLMDECGELIRSLWDGPSLAVTTLSYRQVFHEVLGLNPHSAGAEALADCAAEHCGGDWRGEGRSTLLDLLFSMVVESRLPAGLVFVHDYPACQAALARTCVDSVGDAVARRFEVFFNGVELGNGYFELTDADEQRRRFSDDIAQRARAGKKVAAADERLLAALDAGMPDCAGLAIGFDRLLMQLLDKDEIGQVIPFGDELVG